jgi:hydrogenase-4 component H
METSSLKKAPQFSKELCIACTTCANICPAGVLDLEITNSVHGFRRYPYHLSHKKCTGCERCENECPSGAIKVTVV